MAERYLALNGKYLEDAGRLLQPGDYPRASEKYWGAVAQAVKTVATDKRWRRSSHRDRRRTIESLYQETGGQELLRLFKTAESLHANYYENFMSGEAVNVYAGDMHRLIESCRRLEIELQTAKERMELR